jgi:hypothetical protein
MLRSNAPSRNPIDLPQVYDSNNQETPLPGAHATIANTNVNTNDGSSGPVGQPIIRPVTQDHPIPSPSSALLIQPGQITAYMQAQQHQPAESQYRPNLQAPINQPVLTYEHRAKRKDVNAFLVNGLVPLYPDASDSPVTIHFKV